VEALRVKLACLPFGRGFVGIDQARGNRVRSGRGCSGRNDPPCFRGHFSRQRRELSGHLGMKVLLVDADFRAGLARMARVSGGRPLRILRDSHALDGA
jgi:hypothetical protein